MMDPRSVYDGTRGQCAGLSPGDVAAGRFINEGENYACFKAMGLTDQCAYLHSSSDFAGRNCTDLCEADFANPDLTVNVYGTCELENCLGCETEFRAETRGHIKWAGRDLFTSGLIVYNQFYHPKYPCSTYEDNKIILQDPYAKANSATGIPVSTSESADRFQASYSILHHQETCLYDLSFSMKHDPTLPLAGGWNSNYQNGVDRQEFNRLCNRDSMEIAEDGKPYRERRKFLFQFGQDVKDITGIFDHMSIDFNPCGHHDDIFFGRPHYDFHMYTVSEKWRTIMNCDATPCNPHDCKFDKTFQSTESGKAFFEMETCDEPFPDYIPAAAVSAIKPGSFNKNMPLGFFSLSHTGNPHSGVHSLNVGTALTWNETQVERWSYPVMFMMSFANVITVYEPMVPVEFLQGPESHSFSSPESPPLCQTNMGLPITYNAQYNADTGFTTFQYFGISPSCACSEYGIGAGIVTSEMCDSNAAEMQEYDDVYKRFTGQDVPEKNATGPFGKFSVAEVEAAFDLESGSLILPGDDTYECLSSNNFWTNRVGIPLTFERLETVNEAGETPRNQAMITVDRISTPLYTYEQDRYLEHALLGCFYRPKTDEINGLLRNSSAGICTDDPGALTGIYLESYVAAYVNENTRLLYFGSDHIDDAQVMTQYVLVEALPDYAMKGDEIYADEYRGPSTGEFAGFADPVVQNVNALGNLGHFILTVSVPDLTQSCPDSICGSIIPGYIENPMAPDAPWPDKILENNCTWFPCHNLTGCPEMTCAEFEPGRCVIGVTTPAPATPTPEGDQSPTPAPAPSGAVALSNNAFYLFVGWLVAMAL
jgi:hypothetical protein